MDGPRDLNQVFSDYAALLRTACPAIRGVICYGRDGRPLWRCPVVPAPGACGEFETVLAAALAAPAGGPLRILTGDQTAFLLPLVRDNEQPLGVIAVFTDLGAGEPTVEDIFARVEPVIGTLQRELKLRVRLRDAYRKLSVQATEERLMHEVEQAVQGPPDCTRMLVQILMRCREVLQLRSAAVLIPGKDLFLVQGEPISRVEMEILLENVQTANTGTAVPGSDLVTTAIRGPDRCLVGVLVLDGWTNTGFSDRRRARLGRYLATHVQGVIERVFDSLTGLLAWPAFGRLLTGLPPEADGSPHVIMYFDIDRLHVVNDTLGRDMGDRVIESFAAILREELAGHPLTRIASDSFAALLLDTAIDEARAVAGIIAERFRGLQFGRGDRCHRPSVSIGIGTPAGSGTFSGQSDEMALSTAKVACEAAKDRGRNRVEVYQPEDLSIIQRFDDIQLVGYVRNAIEQGRLVLLGQPIERIQARPDREGVSPPYFEVLVRMLDDEDRLVSPNDFLSAAERYQLMEELDRWVVANTFDLIASGLPDGAHQQARFAINLSGQSLGSEQFLKYVQDRLASSGIPPDRICFEITETVAVANLQRAQNFMHALRRTGCRFSLDDFGTGLSSFAYLKLFPVDTLKIDGSFIRDLRTNVISQSVVAAISEVARVMQLETVAEFVQDEDSRVLLGKLGITWAQGYLIGEPVPLREHLAALTAAPSGGRQGKSRSA